MNTYLILADIREEMPCYTFMIKAKNEAQARAEATRLAGDYYTNNSANEITKDELKIHIKEVNSLKEVENILLA